MATILLIDDEQSILDTLEMFLRRKGHTVHQAATGAQGLELAAQSIPDIVILDIRLPDLDGLHVLPRILEIAPSAKVIMITAFQDMDTAIQAMKSGAFDYIHKPLDINKIDATIQRACQVLAIEHSTQGDVSDHPAPKLGAIIGKSEPMVEIFKMIGVLCQNRAPVLIEGETGTGKELIARKIHENSAYHAEPFVILDCSSVVENLLESELFGYERGAFTGASRMQAGKIETAGRGTLFLDEIGELPLNLQGKFLGFLQRDEFMRVGGHQMLRAQCRIIAATNRHLPDMVQRGLFKEDLYYRLKVVTLCIPPLRDRLADLPLLVEYFLKKIQAKFGTPAVKLHDAVLERLLAHPWHGNVRELENTLIEAVVRANGQVVFVDDIERLFAREYGRAEPVSQAADAQTTCEEHRIAAMLRETDWNRSETARRLGMSRPTLRSKIRKYGLAADDE